MGEWWEAKTPYLGLVAFIQVPTRFDSSDRSRGDGWFRRTAETRTLGSPSDTWSSPVPLSYSHPTPYHPTPASTGQDDEEVPGHRTSLRSNEP